MEVVAIQIALIAIKVAVAYFDCKKSNPDVKKGLDEANTWLNQMQTTLERLESRIDEGIKEMDLYAEDVQDKAYAIEDAVDEFLLHMLSHQNMGPIGNASSKLSYKLNRVKQMETCFESPDKIPKSSSRASTRSNQSFAKGDEFASYETHGEELIRELRLIDQSRLVIFVVGPGGSGKSNLVHEVHSNISGGKDAHNWVQVENMMRGFEGELDPAEKLRMFLQQIQFPVVLDDAWSRDDLRKIVKALPESGSTIIVTSRNTRVASELSPKYIHDLSSGLSPEKSKELFCKKAFHDGHDSWPLEVGNWAEKILKKCECMPLAISAVGTVLLKKETPFQWKTLHDSLGSELCTEDSDLWIIRSNLQPSYRDLPSHLKNCFLYFSLFPEGYKISRERVLRLWVAEKFVMPKVGKTREQVAEDYLIDLVERNLVVASRDSDGVRVRSCRVLELVREINILRRQNFITVLEPEPEYNPPAKNIRRLSAHKGRLDLLPKGTTGCIRTLLQLRPVSPTPELLPSQLEEVLKTSKFLKVLDLEGMPNLEKFPKHVVKLRLLQYLSLRKTEVQSVPNDIKNLQHLETLDLKHTKVTELPAGIFELSKLHHLLVNSCNEAQGVKISEDVKNLTAIYKLSLIKVNNNKILAALKELKELKKLGLVDLETKFGKELCTALEKMVNLSTLDVRAKDLQYLDLDHMEGRSPPLYLQHLYLRGRLQELPKWISQLTSLRKIGIYCSKLNLNPLEVLQALPVLIELDLLDYYTGDKLVFRAGTFKKLMILTVRRFEKLESLEVEDKAMPNLKKLTILGCSDLTRVSLPNEMNEVLKWGK